MLVTELSLRLPPRGTEKVSLLEIMAALFLFLAPSRESYCGNFMQVVPSLTPLPFILHMTHLFFYVGGQIKTSPIADQKSKLLWIGSHDARFYALDHKKREV